MILCSCHWFSSVWIMLLNVFFKQLQFWLFDHIFRIVDHAMGSLDSLCVLRLEHIGLSLHSQFGECGCDLVLHFDGIVPLFDESGALQVVPQDGLHVAQIVGNLVLQSLLNEAIKIILLKGYTLRCALGWSSVEGIH